MKKVPTLDIGPKKLRDWAAKIEAAIKARQPANGKGIAVVEDANGKGVAYKTTQQ